MSSEQETKKTQTALNSASTRRLGRVSWFNNKTGYGFLKIVEDDGKETTDVFVHHSAIKVAKEQFRYLVQGEYVDLTICEIATEKHKFQAADVTGVNGCKLMCETRNEAYSNNNDSQHNSNGAELYLASKLHKSKVKSGSKVSLNNLRQKQPPSSSASSSSSFSKNKEWTSVKKTTPAKKY
jgi:cold shock CspA family protein